MKYCEPSELPNFGVIEAQLEQEDIDYYYKNSPVRLVFAKQITLKNTGNINGQFPPFLSC